MSLNISNKLIEPRYEEKLKKILELIIPTNIFDFSNVKWILYATNRSLNNTSVYTELFGEITGKDIAYCDINDNVIYITNYTLNQNDSFIIEVILHEIAHIKSCNSYHDSDFIDCFNDLVKCYNKRTKETQVLNSISLYKKKGIFEK